jgi:hypothetical protein
MAVRESVCWAEPDALAGASSKVPALTLSSTVGPIELSAFCAERAVLYVYPATGVPGRDPAIDPAPGWDDIPGAAGWTFLKRMVLYVAENHVREVSYPVADPGASAQEMLRRVIRGVSTGLSP